MKSWVVLSDSIFDIAIDDLRRALDDTFPGQFLPFRDDGSFVVGGPLPEPFLIKSRIPGASGLFMLLSARERYVGTDRAAVIGDPALRRLAVSQRAWFSIDLVNRFDAANDAYAFIGPALARLAPQDAAVLVHPTRPIVAAFDPPLRRWLAAGGSPDRLESHS